MKKLTADMADRELRKLQAWEGEGVLTLKEEIYLQALKIALPILEQQERGEGEWIEWRGGERPTLSPFQQVEYLTRIGSTEKLSAGELRWKHLGRGGDIIAYRIIPERDANQNGEQ